MKIDQTLSPTHAVLTLKGDFETDDAASLLEAIHSIRAQGVNRVVASFRFVKYINSTALGAMIRARSVLRSHGGDFAIVKPSPICRDVISKMGLDCIVPMFEDEESALRHMAENQSPAADAAAPELDDSGAVVTFVFPDERASLFAGRSHHGVGAIETVDSERIVFGWNPERHGLRQDQLATMFRADSTIQLKFRIKLSRKDSFQESATIEGFDRNPDGTVVVRAKWSAISEEDRTALARYTADMEDLRRQISDASDGTDAGGTD